MNCGGGGGGGGGGSGGGDGEALIPVSWLRHLVIPAATAATSPSVVLTAGGGSGGDFSALASDSFLEPTWIEVV